LKAVNNNIGGPFHYRVEFRGPVADHEAQAIRALSELLWVGPGRPGEADAALRRCCSALEQMKVLHGDKLQDYVVPVANMVLHAPCRAVRTSLWSRFVLAQAQEDWTLGHLFYWAFRCVADSPDAEGGVREDAEAKCAEVACLLRAKALSLGLQVLLESANDAARLGRTQPRAVAMDPDQVTPLIDLLSRLNGIGIEIVKVKDKESRLARLRSLIQEINDRTVGMAPVPALMLAPHSFRYRDQVPASVLQLPTSEARVLSSKERAPYLVLLEVETHRIGSFGPFGLRKGVGCCRRARPRDAEVTSGHAKGAEVDGDEEVSLIRMSSCEHREAVTGKLLEHDLRPKGIFKKEDWPQVVTRVQGSSQHGSKPGWHVVSMIVKSNADDVRQEELAYRLLRWFQHVFHRHKLRLWLQPFLIVATTYDGGVLETVANAISLSDLKKSYGSSWHSLKSYFETAFPLADQGAGGHPSRSEAIMNFIWSMAAYSIVCYVLAIRDRHNGNILIDERGHILHVDFGFMLCGAPGGRVLQGMGGFEHSAGFKLTDELVEVLNMAGGEPFAVFRQAMADGLLAVRAHADELLALLQLSTLGAENSSQRCFTHPRGYPEAVLEDVCGRLGLPSCAGRRQGGSGGAAAVDSDEGFREWVDKMIDDSMGHWRSRLYDKYQYHFTDVH